MNKQGWLTRNAHQLGGDGQNAASLMRGRAVSRASGERAGHGTRPAVAMLLCVLFVLFAGGGRVVRGSARRAGRTGRRPAARPQTRPPTTGRRRS